MTRSRNGKGQVVVEDRARVRSALEEAARQFERGNALPLFLQTALLKYQASLSKETRDRLLLPKLVQRHATKGAPKTDSEASKRDSAYKLAGEDVGVSASSAKRAFRKHPPNSGTE